MTKAFIIENLTLLQFLQWILKAQAAPTTVVVCSSREAFLKDLTKAVRTKNQDVNTSDGLYDLNMPILGILAEAQSIQLAFCPSVLSLYAYLSVFSNKMHEIYKNTSANTLDEVSRSAILALVNPISLLQESSSHYSARGFGKLVASAFEAAARRNQSLVIVEYEPVHDNKQQHDFVPEAMHSANTEHDLTFSALGRQATNAATDPWLQQIPVVGSGDGRFGTAIRPWLGRSVRLRTVAERWCKFRKLGDIEL